ncbi:hypothetical protein TeGR_g5318 [Tetraparma gracilis]|uniref:ATP synthase A/B type C-terminal domain-containing protein n=1 Tax=Tetraparma gracilis TaxID=2962635 RepID=A0ABQ6MXV9_9STRA|nr:hypothetical protein TeGR_g5318 [Tetraparma gracilis]
MQMEDNLSEIVQLVGKESLSEDQKVVMDIAKVIREDFLQQNAFTDYDYTCPLSKTMGMLACIITFYTLSQKIIADSPADAKVTWSVVKTSLATTLQKIVETKFIDPKIPGAEITRMCTDLEEETQREFAALSEGY